MTDNNKSIIVKFKDVYDFKESEIYLGPEKVIVKEKIDFSYLLEKIRITKSLLQKAKKIEQENDTFRKDFCRLKNSRCKACDANMNFTISQLYENFREINIQELKKELKNHKHPMSRVLNKKTNNKEQKRDEIIQHYKIVHRI